MPAITSIPFWTRSLVHGERGPSFQELRRGEMDGSEQLLVLLEPPSLDHFSFHMYVYVFDSTDLLLSIAGRLHCFFPLPLNCRWLHQRQKRACQVVFHEKRHALHEFSAPSIGPPYFEVWCCPQIHTLDQHP